MIPQFPEFKKVEVGDREAVEAHTQRFEPYSDFNFTSLWAWDTSGERMISELNGNLVVRFTDYSTHEPFLSFLGDKETEPTARALIDHCKENRLPPTLKLMPEISTQGVRSSVLDIVEDRNNFDYVYSLPELSAFAGGKYAVKRKRSNGFRTKHSEARIEIIDLADLSAQQKILDTIRVWEGNKIEQKREYELEHEHAAITRLFQTASSHRLIVVGIFENDSMLGFLIEELLPNEHVLSHFWKCDVQQVGSYDFLMQENARHLQTLDKTLLNFEQDLGVPGLRTNKEEYRPVQFFKKYTVSLSTAGTGAEDTASYTSGI